MAKIIDLGLKKPDDPIFTEGIRIISIRKPTSPSGSAAPNDPATTPTPTTKQIPHEPQT